MSKIIVLKKEPDKALVATLSSDSIACEGIKDNALNAALALYDAMGGNSAIELKYDSSDYSNFGKNFPENFIDFEELEGNKIYRTGLAAGDIEIDISNLPGGYYILGEGNIFGKLASITIYVARKKKGKPITYVHYSFSA